MRKISYVIGIAIQPPIADGVYHVGKFCVEVSYPTIINFGVIETELPRGMSTVFVVSWVDEKDDAANINSNTYHRNLVIYKALTAINEILQACKLVRIGHLAGCGIRTIGIYDTIFHFPMIDDKPNGSFNSIFRHGQNLTASLNENAELAKPHISNPTLPVARRFTRCYELLEHGFYSESFIVSFSIMDDIVQEMLHNQLEKKGLTTKTDQELLTRGIKEGRLKIFLGPLLKIISGNNVSDLWPKSFEALEWLNSRRNKIAHGGFVADYNSAAVAIFACIKIIHSLHKAGLLKAEFPIEMLQYAKLAAAWTVKPPSWVPSDKDLEIIGLD